MKAGEGARLAVFTPAPQQLWIRYAFRGWPGPEGPWCDVASGDLGTQGRAFPADPGRLDDVLYLPPVAPEWAEARHLLAAARLAEGTPVLWQLEPGGDVPPAGATAVYDLLGALLGGELEALTRLPAGAAVLWPLLGGLTDDLAVWEEGCARLAAAGVGVVQGRALALSPLSARRLSEGRPAEVYHALFHREPPSERSFARVAARHGFAPFLPRPLPRAPLSGAGNRELAGELGLAAELWLALDRPVGPGLALARAARWVEGAAYDVAALAREGNLAVIPELEEPSRRLLAERVLSGRSELLDELLAAYVAP